MRPMPFLSRAAILTLVLVLPSCADRAEPPLNQILIVIDGLRPEHVTADLMPNLHALGQRGVVFTRHHSVFPTVTRVNAASIATGSYPETHGLMGNSVYVPAVDPDGSLSTGSKATLDAISAADGRLLTATSLGEVLAASGKQLLALSSGTQGSALLLHHTVASGAVVHPDFTLPATLRSRLDDALGPGPTADSPVDERTRWIVDAYLGVGLDEIRPDLTILWIGDVDTVAHATGLGTPDTLSAIAHADLQLGRIDAALRERGTHQRTNLLVTSDHGFSTHVGGFEPDRILADVTRAKDGTAAGDPPLRAGGAIYIRDSAPETLGNVVEALQRDASVGAIFTRAKEPGSDEGTAPGTLSLELAHWNHARAADILVSANWTDGMNEHGHRGVSTNGGVAGHGSTSPFEIHATLVASGPDFRQGIEIGVPSGNPDLAPTLLHLFDLAAPETMDGRVLREGLREGLRDGPAPDSVEVTATEHSAHVDLANVRYTISASTSTVDGRRYVDRVSVERQNEER